MILEPIHIKTVFKYLPPNCYIFFLAINKKYCDASIEQPSAYLIGRQTLKVPTIAELTIFGPIDFDYLPTTIDSLVLKGSYPSQVIVKLLQKYSFKTLKLEGIECNTMGEFKHIHQLLGTQTKLVDLKYVCPPTDPSLINLTSLQNLTKLHVRLIPRMIPIIKKFQGLKNLILDFGAQSIAKITEDNNNTNPFNSLSVLLSLTSLKIIADSIKQLSSLNDLTSLKSLKVLDLLDVNISSAPKLVFLTTLRNLKKVLLRCKSALKAPLVLADYLKMPAIFEIEIAAFHHDFEASKSFEPIEKCQRKAVGTIQSVEFSRNTSQFEKIIPLISARFSFDNLSATSCPNFTMKALESVDLRSLRGLTLVQCLKIKDISFLKNCDILTSLEVSKINLEIGEAERNIPLGVLSVGQIKEFDVSCLTQLTGLYSLSLKEIPTLKNVDKMTQLMKISVDNCKDFCLIDLKDAPNLMEVSLKKVSASNSTVFASSLKSLTRIDLEEIEECKWGNNELFGIAGCANLKALVIKNVNSFDDNVRKTLSEELPNLKIIS
ncbi:hypothetical protein EIN_425170 [Entamoeba invadens IP1]|uniref:Uncharacterized protein n=1 Tax=Entamoeba invadens IP1 TaxID=370355 RepID=A0A0A1U639_ENTIV|nr:hypothetical protein EIN_425170 [Entamoeba invadens IP1]ELP89795.1 hypothetical protein EIN_425170 [Entamoeba invadens IP1]|eukprot:XP_004256566.1 hypothetical protein EIN_425170 [Entamoeba invadens IP1]